MKKILYLDMDGVLVDFVSGINKLHPDLYAKHTLAIDEAPGIYGLMDPMPGAVEAFFTLSEIYDTYILSTPSWNNISSWSDKAEWVQTHLGQRAEKRLILSHHKNLCHGDYLVDDRLKHGVDLFVGKHIHFNTPEYPDWQSVLNELV